MTVKLLTTSNCSRTVPISYTSTVTTFPQTLSTYRKHNRSTSKPRSQQKHLSSPCIVHKSPTLFSKCNWRLNSSQSYSPLHQLCLYRAKKKKKLSASIFTEAFTIGEDKSDTVCWSNSQATTRERSNVLCNKNGKLASNLSGITGEDFVAFSHTSKRS